MTKSQRKFDWIGFWVSFVFGAIAGAVLGFGVFMRTHWANSPSALPALIAAGTGALLLGLIAGLSNDKSLTNLPQAYTDSQWLIVKIAGAMLVIGLAIFAIIRLFK